MGIPLPYKSHRSCRGEMMNSGYSNLIINDISKKYKSDACLENVDFIPLWNFLIKEIQKIKINQNLGASKNPSRLILFLINLIIKLLKKFIIIISITIFSNYLSNYQEGISW